MQFIHVISGLLLIRTSLSLKVGIPRSHEAPDTESSKPLDKRWDFWFKDFPMASERASGVITAENITDAVDLIVTLSRYIVENVEDDDVTFIAFFGSPAYHPHVMDVFSRIAEIKTTTVGESDELHIIADSQPPATRNDVYALYQVIDGVPIIRLYPNFAKCEDLYYYGPGSSSWIGQLDALRSTSQIILLHELAHFVGDRELYGPVVPGTDYEAAFMGGSILDVPLASAAGPMEKKWMAKKLGVKDKNKVEEILVYGESETLILPQLRYGPLWAVHNADSYAMFALGKLNTNSFMHFLKFEDGNADSNALSIID
ncbi:hypothetical protein HYALB_00007487 [Hymenoscyphus albidus]|uniref:Lysine-specific metallo-endopeptidase domain-containing protein n=1 Tax=Hymenoscyphus albidus TaxID=595503 RepID=A0A9N9Q754_9HELO|nr:hypothetical protein HYALB_00007487 [Hymenoscyphus albidus]